MLPRADIITVNPVGRTESLGNTDGAGDARQEAFQRSLAGLFGKALQGEILSKLTDGSYIVKVAGAAARMQLPAGTQVGGQVPLTLVALSPRPTFQ
ncbi:MAG: flagellar hook-length control protein FliK, partial [Telluria sp.]